MSPLEEIRRRRRQRLGLAPERKPRHLDAKAGLRLLCGLGVLAAAVLLLPLRLSTEVPRYLVGTVASEEILAPFYFEVLKSDEEIAREQAFEADKIPLLFTRTAVAARYETWIDRLLRVRRRPESLAALSDSLGWGLSSTTLKLLASSPMGHELLGEARLLLTDVARDGLVAEADASLLRQKRAARVSTPQGVILSSTLDLFERRRVEAEAGRRAAELHPGGAAADALAEIVLALAVPNLAYDRQGTEAERAAARAAVPRVVTTVQEGERIVHAHERITPEHARKLEALELALHAQQADRGIHSWVPVVGGRVLLAGAFLILGAWFLRAARPRIWNSLPLFALISVSAVLVLVLAAVVAMTGLHPFLVPVPMAAVIVTLLIEDLVAVGLVTLLAALVAVLSGWGLPVALATAVGGVTAAYATRKVVHRIEFLQGVVLVAVSMVAVVLGLQLTGVGIPASSLRDEVGWAVVNAAVSMAAALLFLVVFEKAFGVASNITLLELSDLNRPIFKRMMLEANGTYHHSMIVGTLAEAAAQAVGANPLLARVGGYYHDIGKIAKWGYFGENLREGMRNPHERLTPHMSCLILESHVREGMELAREIGLPDAVAAFIPEHQGTTLMQYFYTKALELDPEVEERDYRYPGPRPQNRETAIVMLADASEAIVRSLDDQTPKNIRAAIVRLFEARLADGQLDECSLTMADLARIRETFTHVLTGVHHGRVKYQWQREGGEAKLAGSRGEQVFYPELETGIGTRGSREVAGSSPAPNASARR